MLAVLVEEVETGKVLNGEEGGVEGNSDLVEDVRGEAAFGVHHLRGQVQDGKSRKERGRRADLALVDLSPLFCPERDLELRSHRVHASIRHLPHVVYEADEALEEDNCEEKESVSDRERGRKTGLTVDDITNESDAAREDGYSNEKDPAECVDDQEDALHAQGEDADDGTGHGVVECSCRVRHSQYVAKNRTEGERRGREGEGATENRRGRGRERKRKERRRG